MTATIKGIIPVMLTPFTKANAIDYAGPVSYTHLTLPTKRIV